MTRAYSTASGGVIFVPDTIKIQTKKSQENAAREKRVVQGAFGKVDRSKGLDRRAA